MSQIISTADAPAAIGPYSQAVAAGGLVFTSGQIPLDPQTGGIVGDTIADQAERVLKNVAAILSAAGTDLNHVVKSTCFLADMGDFAVFNEIYAKYFPACPARSCVAVKTLPKNVLVEVEVVAERA
ncbi:MAG: RidA family protein [Enterocloster asparagiformis]|nr:RidA family protein [Enterocloster asparagiformis]